MQPRGVLLAIAASTAVVACGDAHEDRCARAMARLVRLSEARSMPAPSSTFQAEVVRRCRAGAGPPADPVMRCAFDAPDDATAAACIDAFERAVLHPSPSAGSPGGLNPLLDR